MFAIIAVGDRQHKIVVGEACVFEKIDKQEGEDIAMSGLLLHIQCHNCKSFLWNHVFHLMHEVLCI